ncbi:MAG: hypothetical protein LUH82_06550, partial [Clostridiales bacterium]|nr:hypothetical protein [Clostridiales bacterium]
MLKAANAFYKAAAFLNVSDSETYANIKQITKQIKADVEEAMGSDAYSAANAANIVTYLSGGRPSDAQSDVTFTVTPDYLAAYTSVSQIPETIEYAVVTFTYAHTYSNGYILTSFDKTSETLTDADTYTIFNAFMSVFSAENLALDVSTLDIDAASALITDVRASLSGVEAYSDSVLDTLLGDMLAEAYALEKELDIYLVEYYCNTVVALYEKWANTAYNSDVAAQYAADCAAAEEIYALISDEYKESEAITAALQIYAQVSDTMNYLMAIQTANEIIDIAHSLYEKYSGRTIDDVLCAEWDADYAEYYNLAMAYFTDTSDCQWYAEVTQIVTSDEIVSGAFNDLYTEIAAYESEMEAAAKDAESATLNSALSTSSATAEAGVLSQLLNAVLGDGITALAGITESEANSWVETNISYPNTEDINQEYTDAEWADYVAGLITKIDELISSGYIETLLGTSLSDTVEGLLGKNGSIWTDSLLNTLIEVLAIEIENAVSDYDTLINLSGYTLYYHVDEMINQNSQIKAYISSNYPVAYAALNNSYTGSTSWTDFNNAYGIANLYWGIEDSSNPLETFIDAFRAIFSGYWLLLMALFSGDSVTFAGVTIVSGADGYNDYILPFMEALGIDSSTASDWTSGTTTYYTKASTIDSLYSWSQINTLLRSIIYPLIDRVANILDGDMLTEILGILPNLAYMIDNNILADGLNSLATIKLITGDIEILGLVNLTINEEEVTIYDVITTDGINDLLSTALLSIIEETDDEGNVTASYGVSLPAITWSNLSHTGTPTLRSSYTTAGSCYTIVADTDKVFLELLYYVAKTLIANEQNIIDLLNYLLGTDSSTSTDSDSTSLTDVFTAELIVQALCSQSAETIVNALLLIFIPYYSSDHDWGKDIDFLEVADYYYSQTTETSTSWVDGTMDTTTWYDDETGNYYTYPTYTDDDGNTATITDEDITYVIETLTSIVTNLIEYLAGASIEGLLEEALYNGDIVSSLFTTVYSLFDNETITNLLGFINVTNIYDETTSVDVSKSAVVSNLQSYGFYDVAAKVNAIDASSGHVHTDDCYETTTDADGNETTTLTCGYVTGYADLEITAEDWDIETADDFENAIYAMLEPFASVLAFLTAGQSLTLDVMGIFEFYGSNWYSNALYPIYNALGVTNTGALTPSAYNAQVTNDYSNAAYYLIHPLIEFFEEMSDDPINFGLNALGNISMLIDNDGIQEIIEQVLRPLTNIARALLKFVSPDEITAIYTSAEYAAGTVDDSEYWQYLLEWVMDVLNEIIDENLLGGTYDADADKSWYLNWADLEDQLIPLVNEILPELLSGLSLGTTTDDAGNEVDITISLEIEEIDWKKWAGCGTLSSSNLNSHVTDIPQLACELLKFIWRFIDGNEDAVYTLLEALITDADTVATIETYAAKLFAISDDDFVILLVDLVNALDASTYSVDWSFLYTNYQETTVTYPYDNDGTVTQSDIEQLISVVSGAVSGVLQLLLEDYGGLAGYVETSLFTDSLLTTLASTIYSLFDNDTVTLLLGALQVDGSMETIYADLVDRGYSDIAALIKEQIDLTEAAADDPNATAGSYSAISTDTAWNWGVDELVDSGADLSEIRDAFTQALVTILSPFNSVLKYLLAAGTVSVGGAVDFTGALGYANAIKPLLDALGCDTCSTSRYILDVEDDEDALLLDIINPLLDLAESIMEDPINTALDILPSVANFLYQGGVQTAVEALLYPLLNFADPITSILFDGSVFDLLSDLIGFQTFLDSISDDENVHGHTDDCYDSEGTLTCTIEEYHQYTWENLQEAIIPIVKYFLDDIVISEADGVTISISLADITLGDLAGCGYVSNKLIAAEQEDEVVLVLRWVWDTVLANEDAVYTLLDYYLDDDTYNTLVTYIDRLFDQTGDDIIVMLVELIKGLDDSDFTQDWSFLEDAVKTFVDYPYYSDGTQVTPTAVQSFIDNLSAILNIVIGELLTDYDSLNAFVSGSLYTDELITTITSALYGLLENSTVVAILGVFGIDVSLDGLMSTLDDAGYSKVTALIDTTHTHTVDGGCYELVCTTATCFGEVATETAWEFGVTDSESFIDALTTVLSPLNSLLAIFLNAGTVSLTVDGEELVSLTGANGYANAILPLLEALGCTAEDGLLTADEYAAAVAKDSNALLSSVLTPLLALVERILNDPLGEALEIIPTIANFINQGGVQTAVEALIHPVSNLISPILYVLTGSEDDTIISFVLDLLGVDLDWDNLQNSIIPFVNSLLSDITIAENTTDPNCGLEEGAEHTRTAECYTVSISLSLNNINWAELAGCFAVEPDVSGIYTDTNGYYFDDNDEHGAAGATYSKTATYDSLQCDVLILLLRYVWNQVLINEDAVTTLLETLITDENTLSTIKLYLQNVFLLSSDEFIVLLIGLLADYDDSDYNTAVDWTFLYTGLAESTLAGEESGAYTVEDVTGVVNTVSALVTTVIELLLSSYGGLSGYVETNLYTDSLATTLAALIFGLFDNSVVQTVFSLLSVSVDLESIYDVLNDAGYSDIAALVKAQIDLNNDGDDSTSGSLSAIFTEDADGNTVALDWGIDAAADARDAFTEALVTILSPFNSVLGVLLNTGTISIADAIDFTGADGYANAILPLLTALGCTTALSAEDYAAAAEKDSNNLLLNILNPILDLADTIMADPVGALVDILPSVFNFIDKGGVQYCIESLLHPILDYLDPILTILTKGTDTDNLVDFVIDLLPLFVSTTNDDGSTNTTLETVFTLLDQYGWGDIQNAIVPMLNTLLGNLSINDEISFSVTIPE